MALNEQRVTESIVTEIAYSHSHEKRVQKLASMLGSAVSPSRSEIVVCEQLTNIIMFTHSQSMQIGEQAAAVNALLEAIPTDGSAFTKPVEQVYEALKHSLVRRSVHRPPESVMELSHRNAVFVLERLRQTTLRRFGLLCSCTAGARSLSFTVAPSRIEQPPVFAPLVQAKPEAVVQQEQEQARKESLERERAERSERLRSDLDRLGLEGVRQAAREAAAKHVQELITDAQAEYSRVEHDILDRSDKAAETAAG